MADGKTSTPKRRGLKRLAVAVLALLVVAAILLAITPMLISGGLGHDAIAGAVAKRVNGTVDFDAISLSWTGPQSIDGLAITDDSGREVVDVSVTLQSGLVRLLIGLPAIEAAVSGALHGELREDGSTSFGGLVARDDASPEPARPDGEPLVLDGIPPTTITFDDFKVTLHDAVSGRDVELDGIKGALVYEPGAEASLELDGRTLMDGLAGSVALRASSQGLFDATGTLAPDGAPASFSVTMESMPLLGTDQPGVLDQLAISGETKDLGATIQLDAKARATLEDHDASTLDGSITIDRPLLADGKVNVAADAITGTLHGTSVPMAPLQPLLASLPIRATRDIGPVADITAEFSSGQSKDIRIEIDGEHLTADLSGTVDPTDRSVRGDRLALSGRLHPELVAALTGLTIADVAPFAGELSSFWIPPRGDGDDLDLGAIAAEGTFEIASPVVIARGADEPPLATVTSLRLGLTTAALRDGVRVEGASSVDGASITIDQTITSLLDADGALALAGVTPTGTIQVSGLAGNVVAGLLEDPSAVVAEVLEDTFDLAIRTRAVEGNLEAVVELTGARLGAEARLIRRPEELFVAQLDASVTATPRLVALLQSERETPVLLAAPTILSMQAIPFSLPGRWPDGYGPPERVVTAQLQSNELVLEHLSETAQPIGVAGMDAELLVSMHSAQDHAHDDDHDGRDHAERPDDVPGGLHMAFRLRGASTITRALADRTIADLRYDLTLDPEFALVLSAAVIQATTLSVEQLELALGRPPGTYSGWVGRDGTALLRVRRDGERLQTGISTQLPNLVSNFEATADREILTLREMTADVTLPRAALQSYLSPTPASGPAPESLTVAEDLKLQLVSQKQVHLPVGMLTGAAFDPASADVDVSLEGGPLRLVNAAGVPTSLNQLRIGLQTDDLRDGIDVTIVGRADATAAADTATETPATALEPGSIDLTAKLTEVLDAESRLRLADGTLAADATATRVPTLVLDALGNLSGMLVAAVGAQTDATLHAEDFSSRGGTLHTRIETTNGWLETTVKGGDGAYHIGTDAPLQAELRLTSALGQRLLYKINPLLADVRTAKDPVRATVDNLVLPADRDVSKLNADIELAIGEVEFDSGSLMLQLLKLARSKTDRSTLPGYIEPIKAKIRNGIVTYDRFEVRIDKLTQRFTGQIDLNTNEVDLRTELPVESLADSVKELRGYAKDLVVPIVTRGVFGNLKTEIDPEFDLLGEAAKSGIQGAIDDLLKDESINVGGILDDIFGNKKKDDGKGDSKGDGEGDSKGDGEDDGEKK